MWDRPRSGIESTSPALAGRFFTTEPPEKPFRESFQPMVDWSECTENTWWAAAGGRAAGRRGSWEKRKHGVTRAEGGRLPNKTKDMEEKLSKLLWLLQENLRKSCFFFFKKKKEEIIKRVIQRLWEERSGFWTTENRPWAERHAKGWGCSCSCVHTVGTWGLCARGGMGWRPPLSGPDSRNQGTGCGFEKWNHIDCSGKSSLLQPWPFPKEFL